MKKMKKTILISFLLFSCTLFYGQGNSYNLGFSQVLNYDYSPTQLNAHDENTVGSLIVPSGRVWKIISGTAVHNTTSYSKPCAIFVNNNMVFGPGVTEVQSGLQPISNTPIWLSSGTYSVKFKNYSNSNAVNIKGSLSIVEFIIE